jgi:hypothetical protein
MCLACVRITRRKYNMSERARANNREHNKRYRERLRNAGMVKWGYRAKVITIVGRERLLAAIEAVRESGKIADAHPIIGNVYKWRAIRFFYPKVGAQMQKVATDARLRLRAEIIKPAKPSIIRVASLDLLDRINAVVPRGLPKDQRDDIISDMVEAVLSGRVKLNAIAQSVGQFVRTSYRMDHNKFGPLSLDMPAFKEGETPLIETVSRGLWE